LNLSGILDTASTASFAGCPDNIIPDFKEPLQNVYGAVLAKQIGPKKRSLHAVNEHFSAQFNAVNNKQVSFSELPYVKCLILQYYYRIAYSANLPIVFCLEQQKSVLCHVFALPAFKLECCFSQLSSEE
jgi:hypothetical protein